MSRVSLILKWMAAATVLLLVVVYAGDYLSVQHRMAHSTANNPVEVVRVIPTYAIARKDGQAEFDFGDARSETCVHSLFPHMGYRPCWYANRENRRPIPIG